MRLEEIGFDEGYQKFKICILELLQWEDRVDRREIIIRSIIENNFHQLTKTWIFSLGRRGSVAWSIVPKPKGYLFHAWSGHIPGFQVLCLAGDPQSGYVREATNQCFSLTSMFLSLPSSLPSSLSLTAMKNMSWHEDKKPKNQQRKKSWVFRAEGLTEWLAN